MQKTTTKIGDPVHSPAFFWLWNGRLDADALCAQLEDMCAHGLRNVCIHPFPKGFRPGVCPSEMEPDYLTGEYLGILAKVVRRAGELGMHAYLYDEGGWPSGSACGLVAASDPGGAFMAREAAPAPDGGIAVRRRPYETGRVKYPSVIERGTTSRFIELTHDAIARRLGGDIGSTMRIAFTDEPDMPRDIPGRSLAWTADFADEFLRRKGYDITPFVAALVADRERADASLSKARIDLFDVRSDLFAERYLVPLRDWCHAHGMMSGGHFNNEEIPERAPLLGHGSLLRSLRAMDVPGVDVISRQLFPGEGTCESAPLPKTNPYPRYASSAMHQNGGRFALSESFALFGDSASPAQMKWIVDFQMVRGINLFVFSSYTQSYARHWMALLEPHSGPVVPYWDFEPHFFRYIERTSRFLARGRPGAEIAVLFNVRAFWANRHDQDEAAAAHYAAARELDALNCDYDFAEDRDIAAAEVTDGGKLRIGSMEYRAVVLPSEAWMLDAAKETLLRFEAAGGIVAHGVADLGRVPRTLSVSGEGARAIRVMKRIDGKRRIWFVMNEDMAPRTAEIAFPESGPILRYDPECDACVPVVQDGHLVRSFLPGETAMYVTGNDAATASFPAATSAALPVESVALSGEAAFFGPQGRCPAANAGDSQACRADLSAYAWTLRPLVSHVAGAGDIEIRSFDAPAHPVALGDWSCVLGETFSGKALYRVEFDWPEADEALLDLGEVKWCAAARLNGADLGARFFGPFAWPVMLKKGRNILEVMVANLLANQMGDDAIRDRILRDWTPHGNYDRYQRPFDKLNHESGLFGPVTLRF